MCGILAVFESAHGKLLRAKAIEASKALRHRGPDWSGYHVHKNVHALCHERLAIVDPLSGSQPLVSNDGTAVLCVNGEIYNHKDLRCETEYQYKTGSDCEVIIPLYQQNTAKPELWLNKLRGMFAFIIFDSNTDEFIVARDHVGICPLYIGWGDDGSVWFASEFKALLNSCVRFEAFPPGEYFRGSTKKFTKWF